MRTDADLITCVSAGCGVKFYYVPERGGRALYCLDCADVVFGTRREEWQS